MFEEGHDKNDRKFEEGNSRVGDIEQKIENNQALIGEDKGITGGITVNTQSYRPIKVTHEAALFSQEYNGEKSEVENELKRLVIKEGKRMVDAAESSAVALVGNVSSSCHILERASPIQILSPALVNKHAVEEESVDFEDTETRSLAQSDIVKGLRVKVYSNPRNMAELGIYPRETGFPCLNYSVFDRQELKIMLQREMD